SPVGAFAIGAIAGVLVILSVFFFDKIGIDDPVGASSVHGTCGAFGVLAVGLVADGTYGAGWNNVGWKSFQGVDGRGVIGLLYGGGMSQLLPRPEFTRAHFSKGACPKKSWRIFVAS